MKRYDEEHAEVARSTSTSRSKTNNKKLEEFEDEEGVLSHQNGDETDDGKEIEEEIEIGGHDTSQEVDPEEEADNEKAVSSVGFGNGRTRNKNKPERPVNAFWLFASEVRDQVSAAHPDLKGFKLVSLVVLDLHSFPAISNVARSHSSEW